jgi:group I intron endonuclease
VILADNAWSVYKIINRLSGKSYIGITKLSPRERFKVHTWKALGDRPRRGIATAIRKYGVENFVVVTLYRRLSFPDACLTERALIVSHKTLAPNGYNLTSGGDSMPGHEVSAESRARMSASHKGKRNSRESIEKQAQQLRTSEKAIAQRALLHESMRGKPKTAEHVEKVRVALTGRAMSLEQRAKLIVSQNLRIHHLENRRPPASGFLGVHPNGKSGWMAEITIKKQRLYLGTYRSPEEAHAAYLAAAKQRENAI